MQQRVLVATLALLLSAVAMPTANAEPECIQVYPWSKLCEGDVEGFVGAVLPVECSDCPAVPEKPAPPTWDCIQVYPWSQLCEGDVGGFLRAYCDGCVASPQGEPQCLQVYPWSKLCNGDVGDFVRNPFPGGHHVDCMTMSPYYEACTGNVPGLVSWVEQQVAPILP